MILLKTKSFFDKQMAALKEIEKDEKFFHIFQFGNDKASNVYIRNKIKDAESLGIKTVLHKLPSWTPSAMVKSRIESASTLPSTAGIMIQFPVPEHLKGIEQLVPPHLDVDGLNKNSLFDPCTPSGIIFYLEKDLKINLEGKNICIVGRGDLVGKPLARMLTDKNATVTLCHSKTSDLRKHTLNADIIVCAIGKAKFFNSSYFNPGAIVVDVGINFDENGKMCGDVDTDEIIEDEVPIAVTAVSGGVGLLTRLALMRHLIGLDKKGA